MELFALARVNYEARQVALKTHVFAFLGTLDLGFWFDFTQDVIYFWQERAVNQFISAIKRTASGSRIYGQLHHVAVGIGRSNSRWAGLRDTTSYLLANRMHALQSVGLAMGLRDEKGNGQGESLLSSTFSHSENAI